MTQCANGLLAIPKILLQKMMVFMLDWVCIIQYRGTGSYVGFFSLFFEHMMGE